MEEQIIYGRNAVTEALLSGKTIDTVYIQKNSKGLGKIISLAKESGAVVKDANDEKLNTLAEGGKHGGVAAVLAAAEYVTVDELLKVAEEKNEPPFLIIADEIQDPHNLGALIRTAEAAGAHGIIIPKRRSAGLTSTVFKTSAGAVNWLKVARVSNLVETINDLKKKNIWVYGAEADGQPFHKADLSGAVALVIGSEGFGLGRLVRESCDMILSIDMYGKVNSLNASVSGGILMYEVVRHRR
ncbi:MAG: 23S rRNA (guanosine(2251)-2'-O)-methyltransferase RlmB [Ruminiclostridium sp.]|nr:23S rRNA (guanosine(2251)-2'-O)-methyltransferase RlmB [Ruminiclostridium sp.]MBQ8410812.1 23S rRNA (guanosine(2251)-2'-O)-methyltransferase RlmB [Ruminiclostridium sp.]MBQ8843025.1 23S rRNA (guanosine(2251)-2'-O)-methyltransferase RlmB [Ruminiclostridium sp.]